MSKYKYEHTGFPNILVRSTDIFLGGFSEMMVPGMVSRTRAYLN